jgi:hypothetical protein
MWPDQAACTFAVSVLHLCPTGQHIHGRDLHSPASLSDWPLCKMSLMHIDSRFKAVNISRALFCVLQWLGCELQLQTCMHA